MSSRRSQLKRKTRRAREKQQQAKAGAPPRLMDPLDALEAKVRQSEALPGLNLVRNRPGQEKMSAVLLDFLEPYRAHAKTRAAFERLVVLGMMAWNSAILGDDSWKEALREELSDMALFDRVELQALVAALIERKQRHFAENRRLFVSYVVADQGNSWNVSVATTQSEPEHQAEH